jgi:hypothetical protein
MAEGLDDGSWDTKDSPLPRSHTNEREAANGKILSRAARDAVPGVGPSG